MTHDGSTAKCGFCGKPVPWAEMDYHDGQEYHADCVWAEIERLKKKLRETTK